MGWTAWTPEENELVHTYYPDYRAMMRALPSRSFGALKKRASFLDVAQPQRAWTGVEAKRLRALCAARLTWAEIQAALPHRSIDVLKIFARKHRIAYFRPYKPADDPCVQAVRERAAAMKINMTALDRMAKSGVFFRKPGTRRNLRHIAAGAAVLGGEIRIEWEPLAD